MSDPTFAEKRIDMMLFENLYGARRTTLTQNRCGYLWSQGVFPVFLGHEHFDDERYWIENYNRYRYGRTLEDIRRVEEELKERKLHTHYMQAIVNRVCPRFENLSSAEEVWQFYFDLVHTPLKLRHAIAASVARRFPQEDPALKGEDDRFLAMERDQEVLERSIELAVSWRLARSDAAKQKARSELRRYILGLSETDAYHLAAMMYVGRDGHSVAHALRSARRQLPDVPQIAAQMLEKPDLAMYLQEARKLF